MAGGDYGSPGAYYEAFFSRMSRMVKKPAEVLRFWYFDRYMPRFCDILKKYYRPRPGTAELFEALTGAAFPFAVYSDYPLTAERLAALGLDTGWGKLYGPEHFGAQKPAARPFVSIAGDMGVLPEHTMVIGDRDDTDGAGAAAAGMGYIGVGTRKKRETHAVFDWETLTGLLMDRLKFPA
jgi:FMN phosphatase YigB (HAD superfamily)